MVLEGVDTPGDGYWAQGPNQHHQLRILDVDGTRVVIGAIVVPGHLGRRTGPTSTRSLDSIQIG